MFSVLFVITAFLSLLRINMTSDVPHWGYPDDYNTNEEFPHWGGICDSGYRQSPINLSLRGALKGIYGEVLQGVNYGSTIRKVSMTNTGHSLQISEFDMEISIKGGPLKNNYILEQIHFHWWSEHTIDNIRYPFEMHMVHRNTNYQNMTAASEFKDGIVVLGVLFHASMERNEVLDDLLLHFDQVKDYEQINKPLQLETSFEINDFLPTINNYITYEGSLTTPSCAEAVTWIVMAETHPVTIDQVEILKSLESEKGTTLTNNYRYIQKTNNRAVIIASNGEHSGTTLPVAASILIVPFIFITLIA